MTYEWPSVSVPLICSNTTWNHSRMTSPPVDCQSEWHGGVDCVLETLSHNLTRQWTQTTAAVFRCCRGEARWRLKAAQPRQSTTGPPSSPLSLLSNTTNQKKTEKAGFTLLSFSFPFILAANPFRFCLSRHMREAPLAGRQTVSSATAAARALPGFCSRRGGTGRDTAAAQSSKTNQPMHTIGIFLFLSVSFCFFFKLVSLFFFTWLVILSGRAAEGNKATCQADCQTGSNNLLFLESEVLVKQLWQQKGKNSPAVKLMKRCKWSTEKIVLNELFLDDAKLDFKIFSLDSFNKHIVIKRSNKPPTSLILSLDTQSSCSYDPIF